MAEVETENGDKRAPGVQLVPSEAEETPTGLQVMDTHEPRTTVVVDSGVPAPLTAKEYRDAGYVVDDKLDDDAVPALVQADRPAELRTVVLPDGEQVTGDDIPTASALESRELAKTPEEVTAEAEEIAEEEDLDQVPVDTTPTVVDAIREQAEEDAQAGEKAAAVDEAVAAELETEETAAASSAKPKAGKKASKDAKTK